MATDAGTERTDRPALASGAVGAAVAVAAAALLVGRVGPSLSVGLAAAHAALFAASLWLVGRDRRRGVALGLAGTLALFVGASFFAAVGYATLQAVAELYPVADISQVRPKGLELLSVSVVVVGGTVAMVGAATAVWNLLRAETVWSYAKLAVKTFVVPLVAAAVMLLSTLLGRAGDGSTAPLVAPLADSLATVAGAMLSPSAERTRFLTLCPLVAATALAVDRAVDALSVAELTADRPDDRLADAAATVRRRAGQAALAAAAAVPVALAELAVVPTAAASVLGTGVYDALVAVSTSATLRWALAAVLALSVGVAGTISGLRRVARTTPRAVAVGLTPFLGGVVVVGVVAAVHGAVVSPALEFVAGRLPGEFASAFGRQSAAVVDFYGTLAVAMTTATLLVGLTALLSLTLASVVTVGLLPAEFAAPALAAAGTFVAAAFAAGGGAGPGVVLAGLVASLLVWDAGEFGLTLGREVGRSGATRAVEAVHLAGTLAVGAVAAVAAWAVYALATGVTITGAATLPFALAVVVAGLVLFAVSLR